MASAEERVRKLEEEIEAEEKAAYGNPVEEEEETTVEEPAEPEAEAPEETEEEQDETEETDTFDEDDSDEEEQEEEPEKPEKKKRVSWKAKAEEYEKRFNNYKGSTDATIHSLRVENTNLKEHLNQLSKAYGELEHKVKSVQKLDSSVDYSQILTEEQREYLGDEGIASVSNIVQAILKQKDEEYNQKFGRYEEQIHKQQENNLQSQKQAVFQEFLGRLGQVVPNFVELSKHSEFGKWAEQPDPINGRSIKELFQEAEQRGDVRTVANYLKEFEGIINPSKKLDEHITPTGRPSGVQQKQQQKPKGPEMLSLTAIEKFYSDITKGRYKGRADEVNALEAQIAAAEREGRIIDDRKPF